MKKTKIDWCDCSANPVVGCPNKCKYCYGCVLNNRFHFVKDWNIPEWKPKALKQLCGKKPQSVFIDSMSDIGTWQQEWFNEVLAVIKANPQHRYIALTKRLGGLYRLIARYGESIGDNFYMGISVTHSGSPVPHYPIDFLSVEPLLDELEILPYLKSAHAVIIGAETGRRKGKVIPQKAWVDKIVATCDRLGVVVFMKESLRKIMGDDFRQDKLPWQVEA